MGNPNEIELDMEDRKGGVGGAAGSISFGCACSIEDITAALIKAIEHTKCLAHSCHLEDIELSSEEHKQHHSILRTIFSDGRKLVLGIIIGACTAIGGGLMVLLWAGLQGRLLTGGK